MSESFSAAATGKAKILVVDDDPNLLRVVSLRLEKEGYKVVTAESAEAALVQLAATGVQLVLTDLKMAGMDGMALFEEIVRRFPALPVIIMTAHGTVSDAVVATRRGVFGYLSKPFEAPTLIAEVERAVALGSTTHSAAGDESWRREIITRSPVMQHLLSEAKLVAATTVSVLISGPTGSGKELLARAIHTASPRRDAPFMAINCAAIPEQLLESELFGHRKGAFTGAIGDRDGLFRATDGGTLFLDEIGDMPLPLQAKLLRVLQERQVRPIGSTQTVPFDVRVISATHRDLHAHVAANQFREDLFYRLKVVVLTLPPLSERREDIPLLASRFLGEICSRYGRTVRGFAPESMERLMQANWPGNVRQLYHVVETAVALATDAMVPSSLIERALSHQSEDFAPLDDAKKAFERDYLLDLLKQTRGNVTQAAKLAKRNRSEFYSLLHRHHLDPALFKEGS